jgi:hypothetical protein
LAAIRLASFFVSSLVARFLLRERHLFAHIAQVLCQRTGRSGLCDGCHRGGPEFDRHHAERYQQGKRAS